jgi:hypothetical protein
MFKIVEKCGGTLAGHWRDSGGTVAGQWRDSGGTVAGQWRDSGGTFSAFDDIFRVLAIYFQIH